ncbi:hypothetical protein [Desulfosarcina ovata]|uniref:Uncharacterized protein n=2 Tax=Desulfosarcina ovata TaxID=83564 RepID=A0A5K8A3N1_9BACT|nr:hypothetical protein [Desulfosarcina ovata]BBO80395.1 hypothetical protein DSCO28_09610 [Desulfosarcina ovata subsp. sediminis]BBO87067.1 hypothetical protein DSCOOX_02470 [Desulfosarcina ovata subsp. ovata]
MIKKDDNPKFQKFGLCYQDGRVWFTREAERRFYFILTLIMLVTGILYKIGAV